MLDTHDDMEATSPSHPTTRPAVSNSKQKNFRTITMLLDSIFSIQMKITIKIKLLQESLKIVQIYFVNVLLLIIQVSF